MKSLTCLSNVQKASLLHNLLPGCIPAALEFIEQGCQWVKENTEQLHEQWTNGFISSTQWVFIAIQINDQLKDFKQNCTKQPGFFAERLFGGLNALFTVQCLIKYCEDDSCPPKFKHAILLLFGSDEG